MTNVIIGNDPGDEQPDIIKDEQERLVPFDLEPGLVVHERQGRSFPSEPRFQPGKETPQNQLHVDSTTAVEQIIKSGSKAPDQGTPR